MKYFTKVLQKSSSIQWLISSYMSYFYLIFATTTFATHFNVRLKAQVVITDLTIGFYQTSDVQRERRKEKQKKSGHSLGKLLRVLCTRRKAFAVIFLPHIPPLYLSFTTFLSSSYRSERPAASAAQKEDMLYYRRACCCIKT